MSFHYTGEVARSTAESSPNHDPTPLFDTQDLFKDRCPSARKKKKKKEKTKKSQDADALILGPCPLQVLWWLLSPFAPAFVGKCPGRRAASVIGGPAACRSTRNTRTPGGRRKAGKKRPGARGLGNPAALTWPGPFQRKTHIDLEASLATHVFKKGHAPTLHDPDELWSCLPDSKIGCQHIMRFRSHLEAYDAAHVLKDLCGSTQVPAKHAVLDLTLQRIHQSTL